MSAEIKLLIDSYSQSDSLKGSNAELEKMRDLLLEINKLQGKSKASNDPKEVVDSVQKLKKNTTEVNNLRIAHNKLAEAKEKTNKVTSEQIKDDIRYSQLAASQRKDLKTNIILQNQHAGIIEKMRAQLSKVTKEWTQTTDAAQLDEKVTGTLANQKLVLTEKLKSLEKATGDHRREVGNYGLALSKLSQGLGGTAKLIASVGEAFGYETEGLRELAHIGKEFIKTSIELREIHKGEAELEGEVAASHLANAAATDEETISKEANIAVTEEEIAAQKALNESMLSNPYLLAIAGIAALASVITTWVAWSYKAKKAEEERSKAVDGSIILDKQAREEHNAAIYTLQKLTVEYELLTGAIDAQGAAIKSLAIDSNQAITKLNEDTNEKLKETEGFWTNFGGAIKNSLKFEFTAGKYGTLDPLKAQEEEKKLIVENANRKFEDIQKEHDARLLKIQEEDSLKALADFKDLEVARLENIKAGEELIGTNIVSIQRKILYAQLQIDKTKVANEADAQEQIYILTQKYNTALLELDKEWAEQRRRAHDDLVKLEISNMQDGYDKQLAVIEENYRQQREKILYDTTLTASEKKSYEIKYGIEEAKAINDLNEKTEKEKLQKKKDANTKLLEADIEYYNFKMAQDKEQARHESAIDDAMNDIALNQLKDSLEKKKISQLTYDEDVLKNEIAALERRNSRVLSEDQKDVDNKKAIYEAALKEQQDGVEGADKKAEQALLDYQEALNKIEEDGLTGQAAIDAKKAALRKLDADDAKKTRDGILDESKKFVSEIMDIEEKRSENRVAQLDRMANAEDEAITQQQIRAAQGLSNTLAFEEDKKVQLERQAIAEEKRQERLKKLEAYWNLFAELAKTDPDQAALKAAEEVFVAEGLSLAFAAKGGMGEDLTDTTTLLGDGNFSKSHANGDIPTLISPKEGILTEQNIAALGGSDGFYNLKKMLENPIPDNVFARQNDSFTNAFVTQQPQVDIGAIVDGIGRKFEDAIKKIERNDYHIDTIGNIIHTKTKQNSKVVTNRGVFIQPHRKKFID